jgi:hypothetical protein
VRGHLAKLAVTTLFLCFIYAATGAAYAPGASTKAFAQTVKPAQEKSSTSTEQSVAQEKPADKHSSPEDRQRLVSIAHKLEVAPLDPALAPERQWAASWTIGAPDVHVRICPALLGDLRRPTYKYRSEMSAQLLISIAAFLIEHPEQADNYRVQSIGGMEGVLKAYASITKVEPQATAKSLDALLHKQREGKLADAVGEIVKSCL